MPKSAMTWILGILALFFAFNIVMSHYAISRDILAWKDRAQVSSEPNDMHDYMSRVRDGLNEWEMTTGNADIIFPTASSDMALIMRSVEQHIAQSEILTEMDRSSAQYQTGLDNLRGSIRELDIPALDYWSFHQGLLSWVCLVVLGILAILHWSREQ